MFHYAQQLIANFIRLPLGDEKVVYRGFVERFLPKKLTTAAETTQLER